MNAIPEGLVVNHDTNISSGYFVVSLRNKPL